MTKLSSLSSSSASADPYGLSAKLNKITDLQIRILLSEIFAAQGNSDAAEIPDDDLIRQCQYWASQLGANTSTQDLTGAVESAMQVAYDYFKNHSGIEKSSLLPTGQFAAYVTSFLEHNKGECCEIMRKFCDYLYQVGLRPQERQAALLQNFPPEAQYLNCLGGTSERIDDLYAELTSQEKHRPFLRAHDVVMRQVVDALKKNVLSGNEVHIPRYLEYSLGLRAGMVIYPQSQIPLTASFAIHLNYPSILKKFLLKNLSEELAERQKDIRAIYQEIGEKFPGRDLQKMDVINDAELVKFLNNRLKRYEVDGGSFVEFADDECTTCRLDLSRFEKVAAIPPSIKLLNDFLAREEIQNLTNEDALSFKGKEFTELASDPKIFFSERGWNCVVLLLTEEVGKPTIYRDSVVGFEALWMMGEHFAGNAPTVFVAAVNELGGLQKIRNKILPNIAKLLPHQAGKMARIESLHGHYMANPAYSYSPNSSLVDLFLGNLPLELIIQRINSRTNVLALNQDINQNLHELACRQIVNRPDVMEIFQALRSKIGQSPGFSCNNFLAYCLAEAAQTNNIQLFQYILTEFSPPAEVFAIRQPIHIAAERDNPEIARRAIEYVRARGWAYLISALDGDERDPFYVAANYGSAATLEAMHNAASSGGHSLIGCVYDDGLKLSHLAAFRGHAKVIDVLIKLGENFAATDSDGKAPAHYAAEQRHAAAITAIKDAHEKYNRPLNIAMTFNTKDNEYYTPLISAIFCRDKETIMALAEVGVRGNVLNQLDQDFGKAPIHWVVEKEASELVSVLRSIGADMNVQDELGITPLSMALQNGDLAMVKALRAAGVNLDQIGERALSLLHEAIKFGNTETAKLLTDAGANINYRYANGDTALHRAIKDNNLTFFLQLVERGADLGQKDSEGRVVADLAQELGRTSFLNELEDGSAQPSGKKHKPNPPASVSSGSASNLGGAGAGNDNSSVL